MVDLAIDAMVDLAIDELNTIHTTYMIVIRIANVGHSKYWLVVSY